MASESRYAMSVTLTGGSFLQGKHHAISLEAKASEQKTESMEDEIEELKESNENLQWELQKARKREDR